MVTSETGIANLALAKLGGGEIVSIDDTTDPNARSARLHYEDCRDEVLRRALWPFAIKPAILSRMATPPISKFGSQYAMPFDLVRFIEINGTDVWANEAYDDLRRYAIEGGDDSMPNMLLTDDAGPTIAIRYIRRVEDVTKYDSLFRDAFATLLASKMAPAITGDPAVGNQMLSQYEQLALPNARNISASEKGKNVVTPLMQMVRSSGIFNARR